MYKNGVETLFYTQGEFGVWRKYLMILIVRGTGRVDSVKW